MISTRLHAFSDYVIPATIALLGQAPGRGPGTRRIMEIGPPWHLAYTLVTRHEGGLVPHLSMRTHLALDALSALTFVGAGILMRREPARDRALLVGLGLAELAWIALSDDKSDSQGPITPHG
ncbi:hypothetical protein [Methylorubrum extorquens]